MQAQAPGVHQCAPLLTSPLPSFVPWLADHKHIKPKSIHNAEIIEGFAKEYMYLSAIAFIVEVRGSRSESLRRAGTFELPTDAQFACRMIGTPTAARMPARPLPALLALSFRR